MEKVAGESGKIDPMHQFQIEPLAKFDLFGYDISFTNSSLFMLVVLGAIWVFMAGGMKRELVPGRWQMATEYVTGFINNMMSSSIGPEGKKYVPLVFSLFMFILFANFMGMMPFGIVPGVHAFTVTSHLTVTAVLAILSFGTVLGRRSLEARLSFLQPVRAARHAMVADVADPVYRAVLVPDPPVQPCAAVVRRDDCRPRPDEGARWLRH